MFIHLGEDIVIRSEDVIAIIDGQVLDSGPIIKEFLNGQRDKSSVIHVSDLVKSIVVTTDSIYFSPLSSGTLKKRSQVISELVSHNE